MFLQSIPRGAFRFAALGWAILIFVASSIPGNEIPEVGIVNFDKLVHMGIYACLAALVYLSFRNQTRLPRLFKFAVVAAILVASLYGASDEIHQLWTPGRTCDIWDWTADTFGAILGVLAARLVERRLGRIPGSEGGSPGSAASL